jgi:hypothetical protein
MKQYRTQFGIFAVCLVVCGAAVALSDWRDRGDSLCDDARDPDVCRIAYVGRGEAGVRAYYKAGCMTDSECEAAYGG